MGMGGVPSIRPARPEERALLEDLQWRSSLIHEAYRQALLADRGMVQLPSEHIEGGGTLVCEIDGKPAGFAVVLFAPDGGDAELDGLFVEPGLIGTGIGQNLVAEAMTLARARDASSLKVVAAPEAERFYRKCGFERVGETDTELGKALLMAAGLRA